MAVLMLACQNGADAPFQPAPVRLISDASYSSGPSVTKGAVRNLSIVVTPNALDTGRAASIAVSGSVASVASVRKRFTTQPTTTWTTQDLTSQVQYMTTGGTVANGVYTAPAVAGKYKITARIANSTAADSTTVTVMEPSLLPPKDPSTLYPNEPAGYTRIIENRFASTPAAGFVNSLQSPAVEYGPKWWTNQAVSGGRLMQYSDATAPISGPATFRFTFPTGMVAGTSSALTGAEVATNPTTGLAQDYSEWYEHGAFKVGDSAGFETQQNGVKVLGYWGAGFRNVLAEAAAPTTLFAGIMGNGTNTSVMTSWELRFNQQTSTVNTSFPPNVNVGTRVIAGKWHQYELLMKVNTIGSANGIFKFWLDGVLCFDRSNMVYVDATNTLKFFGRKLDPVWGGLGGYSKTRDDYLYWDHIYVSARP